VNPNLGYEIAILVVVLYAVAVYLLLRAGRVGPDRALSLLGPALMIKTQRGRSALDRWSRFKRFWTAASDLGIALAVLAMAVIVALLVFGAVVATRLSPAQAPSVTEAVGIPGLNPFIPIGYGIIALVIGIVLHELSHGVVARSQNIGVKSLGILWCVIPIGAFVEQDDKEMMAAPRRKRDRVAAAGVLANFGLAVLFFFALSGLVVSSVQTNANGVGVGYVVSDSPAANLTLAPGDIITSINGTATPSVASFESSLANSRPGETVAISYYSASAGTTVTSSVTLATNPTNPRRGFLGVGVSVLTPAQLKQTLVWPLGSDQGPFVGIIYWIILPLGGLEPMSGPTTDYYHITGPLGGANSGMFWIAANVLYWLAWMNLLLGLSNALPLVPLDGGLLFRDFAASVAARFRRGWNEAKLEQFAGRAVTVSSLVVLLLIVWQFVVPRLL